MAFQMPLYTAPDFSLPGFREAPDVKLAPADMDGVAPEGYHSTSMFPEYFKLSGRWTLAEESRMDSSVVLREDGRLELNPEAMDILGNPVDLEKLGFKADLSLTERLH